MTFPRPLARGTPSYKAVARTTIGDQKGRKHHNLSFCESDLYRNLIIVLVLPAV
jgi:hypothetical protein